MKIAISIFQKLSILVVIFIVVFILFPFVIGIKPFIVLSGSMEPGIKTGSIVYINTYAKPEDIRVGDIIGFDISNGQATHRVVKINEDKSFVTKGDNNENEDLEPVTYEKYKGKTLFCIPYIGMLLSKSKTKLGVFLITSFIGLNVLCILFDKILSEDEEETKGKALNSSLDPESLAKIENKVIDEIDNMKSKILDEIFSLKQESNSNMMGDIEIKNIENNDDNALAQFQATQRLNSDEIRTLMKLPEKKEVVKDKKANKKNSKTMKEDNKKEIVKENLEVAKENLVEENKTEIKEDVKAEVKEDSTKQNEKDSTKKGKSKKTAKKNSKKSKK